MVHLFAWICFDDSDEHKATLAQWIVCTMSLARFFVVVCVAAFGCSLLESLALFA